MEDGNEPLPRGLIIREALAEYFECDVDDIGCWVLCCERKGEDGQALISSAWSAIPHWYLLGLVGELKIHIERLRTQAEIESMAREE